MSERATPALEVVPPWAERIIERQDKHEEQDRVDFRVLKLAIERATSKQTLQLSGVMTVLVAVAEVIHLFVGGK